MNDLFIKALKTKIIFSRDPAASFIFHPVSSYATRFICATLARAFVVITGLKSIQCKYFSGYQGELA